MGTLAKQASRAKSAEVVPPSPTHRELPFAIGSHSSTATYHQPLNAIRTFPGLAVQIVWNGRISHRHTTSVAVLQQTVFAMPADQQHLDGRTEKLRGVSRDDWPSTITPDRYTLIRPRLRCHKLTRSSQIQRLVPRHQYPNCGPKRILGASAGEAL